MALFRCLKRCEFKSAPKTSDVGGRESAQDAQAIVRGVSVRTFILRTKNAITLDAPTRIMSRQRTDTLRASLVVFCLRFSSQKSAAATQCTITTAATQLHNRVPRTDTQKPRCPQSRLFIVVDPYLHICDPC